LTLIGTPADFQYHLGEAVKETLPMLFRAGIDPYLYGTSPGYTTLYNTTRDIANVWEPEKADQLFGQLPTRYDKHGQDAEPVGDPIQMRCLC